MKLLVLGLGNTLMGDDGLGPRAIELLAQSFTADDGVEVLDGGTLGLMLLPTIVNADALVLVDAIRTGGEPGTLVRLEDDAIPRNVNTRISPHEIGVVDLLGGALLTGHRPERTLLLGIVPEDVSFRVGLSPAVEAGIPELLEAIVSVARQWGHPFRRAA